MFENSFNQLAWLRFGIQKLDTAKSLPAEFMRGTQLADLSDINTHPELTLVTAPFSLSSATQTYLSGLSLDEYNAMDWRCYHEHAGTERYPMSELPLMVSSDEWRRREMTKWLPDKPNRNALIEDISRLIDSTTQVFANTATPRLCNARLSFSSGWAPQPEDWRLHHDLGDKGVRVFLPLHGDGPLVAPALAMSAKQRQQTSENIGATLLTANRSLYPSFAELAYQVPFFQLGRMQAGVWRPGAERAADEAVTHLPLPHAVPPHDVGIRANLVLDFW